MASLISCIVLLTISIAASTSVNGNSYVVLLKQEGIKTSCTRSLHFKANILQSRKEITNMIHTHHESIIRTTLNKDAADVKIHTYTDIISGFSARLSAEEASKLQSHPDVYAVTKDSYKHILSTRSYTFLDLDGKNSGAWKKTKGTDVIIGVVDTGVWPENASFNDSGYGPVPSKYTGICQKGQNFTTASCNRKLIGAQYFGDGYAASVNTDITNLSPGCNEYASPRDAQGHGSHVASVVAGSRGVPAALDGIPFGSASGVAYGARLAIYKAFWCAGQGIGTDSDIIAAVDKAVADGVDIISGNFGGSPPVPHSIATDPIAFVMYYCTVVGVPVVMPAGNDGRLQYTVGNSSPWIFSIGAGTVDRAYANKAVLGNGISYSGQAIANRGTQQSSAKRMYSLVDAAAVGTAGTDPEYSQLCLRGYLDPALVKGKIVLCLRGLNSRIQKGQVVKDAGGVGMIQYNQAETGDYLPADYHWMPATAIGHRNGLAIKAYINSTANARAYITATEIVVGRVVNAPSLSNFSSLGPNAASLNILKPDIIAPGENIMAAWSQNPKNNEGNGVSPLASGKPSAWNVMSGSSTSGAFVSGAVALLKSLYPDWLPSMLFSAIATTAQIRTNNGLRIQSLGKNANPFSIGSGHLNVNKAVNPGLVYKIEPANYSTFICSLDSGIYDSPTKGKEFGCTTPKRAIDLNIPSISFVNISEKTTTRRTLTNVGPAGTYSVFVAQPSGAKLTVQPSRLTFRVGASLSFLVTLDPLKVSSTVKNRFVTIPSTYENTNSTLYWTFSQIIWYDNKGHSVRIPVVVNVVRKP